MTSAHLSTTAELAIILQMGLDELTYEEISRFDRKSLLRKKDLWPVVGMIVDVVTRALTLRDMTFNDLWSTLCRARVAYGLSLRKPSGVMASRLSSKVLFQIVLKVRSARKKATPFLAITRTQEVR